jgi:DNA-binding beta-propeller fold protein YncE
VDFPQKNQNTGASIMCRISLCRTFLYPIVLLSVVMFVCLQGFATPSFAAEAYKGPIALCVTKDGKTIYVVNRDSHEIAVLNTADDKIVKTMPLGDDVFPLWAVLSADEKTLYVVGGNHKGRVLAVDVGTGMISKTVAAGHTPTVAVISPDGSKLFVCNQFTNDVHEYRLPDLTPTRTFKVVREPRAAVVTKDGKYLLVANSIPLMPTNFPDDENADIYVAAEVTIINIETGETRPLLLPNGSGALHGMCISPDGRYIYITEIIARFLLPTTQVERGWMNTAGIAVIDTTQIESETNGFVNSVLIDDIDRGAANPWGITTSADGTKIYVAIAGTSELITIDAVAMHKKLDEVSNQENLMVEVSDNLAFLAGLKNRTPLPGKGARAITVAGENIYIGMYFSDTLQKIDGTRPRSRPTEIALGPTPNWTPERRGEIWWNDATLCFQHWQSCASCHPDARMDGYNWDLLNDGMGNPKNAKSLLYSHVTPPTMWEGVRDHLNPTIPGQAAWDTSTQGIQCVRTGFKFILFTEPNEEKCRDIDAYLFAEKPVPSPYLVDGKLSAKAERGKKIFEDPKIGCLTCHPGPYYTDQKMHDVNTRCYYDRTSYFDTPTLIEVWRTAPYLHDGRYVNMRDVFKIGLHGDVSGDVGGLTDEQIDELVEYIMSL